MGLLSVKVDDRLREKMKKFPHINWPEVMRKAVEDRLQLEEALTRKRKISRKLLKTSIETQDRIRQKSLGKWSSTEEIRKRGNNRRDKTIVVDASVATRWFVNEKWTDVALQIRDEYYKGLIDIVAPYLMTHEICNALRYDPDLGMKDVLDSPIAFRDIQLSVVE